MNFEKPLPAALLDAEPDITSPASPWLISGYLPAGALATVTVGADAEAAATILLLGQAAHLAAGAPWAGHRVPPAGTRVCYFDMRFREAIGTALRAIEKHGGFDVGDRLRFMRGSIALGNRSSVTRLVDLLRPDPPQALFLDSVNFGLNGLDEDDPRVVAGIDRLRSEMGCAVIVVVSAQAENLLTDAATVNFVVEQNGMRIALTARRVREGPVPPPAAFDLVKTSAGIVPVAVDSVESTNP